MNLSCFGVFYSKFDQNVMEHIKILNEIFLKILYINLNFGFITIKNFNFLNIQIGIVPTPISGIMTLCEIFPF